MSEVCHVFSRELTEPVELLLTVEITATGLIDHIDGQTYDDQSPADDMRVLRAVLFIDHTLQRATDEGFLARDLLKELPAGAEFAIERAVMDALAELQEGVVANLHRLTKQRGAA